MLLCKHDVTQDRDMNQFWRKTEEYLKETLGIEVTLESWPGKRTLPLYLRQNLEFAVFRILDRNVLAAIATKQEPFPDCLFSAIFVSVSPQSDLK